MQEENIINFINSYFESNEYFFITMINHQTNKTTNYHHNIYSFERNLSRILYANNQKTEIPVLILKAGDYILVQMQYNTGVISEIYSASNFPTDYFGLAVKVSKQQSNGLNTQTGVVSNIRYYIFP